MKRHLSLPLIALALIALAAATAAADEGVELVVFAEGSAARILGADYLLEHFVSQTDDGAILEMPGMPAVERRLPLSQGGPGPEESYVPHSSDAVRHALETVSYPRPVEDIEIVLLPFPRMDMPASSALGRRIFLSPESVPTPFELTAFTVTHELGHLFQYERMPDTRTDLWDEYRQLRGITDTSVYNEGAVHADQPHEIFAEDFRYLFGGEAANYAGSIENHDLPLPDRVDGLREFFLALSEEGHAGPAFRASCYPNPFNPRTQIRVDVDASLIGMDFQVSVYDAGGRLVRDVYEGSLYSHQLSFDFDGRDDAGRPLPSGAYFTSVRIGGERQTTKMILLQ